jgi:hypothetical protein
MIREIIAERKTELKKRAIEEIANYFVDFSDAAKSLTDYGIRQLAEKKATELFDIFKGD